MTTTNEATLVGKEIRISGDCLDELRARHGIFRSALQLALDGEDNVFHVQLEGEEMFFGCRVVFQAAEDFSEALVAHLREVQAFDQELVEELNHIFPIDVAEAFEDDALHLQELL